MIAAVHARFGTQSAKCPRCQRDPILRKTFGCDAPSDRRVWTGRCPACLGGGCKECEMRGTVEHKRCPQSMSSPVAHQVVSLASYYREGHLPDAGGIFDQGARTMDLIAIACGETQTIEAEIAEGNSGG